MKIAALLLQIKRVKMYSNPGGTAIAAIFRKNVKLHKMHNPKRDPSSFTQKYMSVVTNMCGY